MQISTLKISDGLLLSWRKKHLQFWVRPKDCIFFSSLVNRTGDRTGKSRSQHSSTQLNLGPERLKLREQHNPNKKPSLHQPRETRPWQLCRYSKIPGGRSTGWKKTPTPCKGQATSQRCCCQEEADVGETEGNTIHEVLSSNSLEATWEDLVWMKIHLAQSLCVSLAILTTLQSLVKWWLLREKRRQSAYLDSAFLPTLGVSS